MKKEQNVHSSAWIVQTWVSFAIAIAASGLGIWHLPVDAWVRGFMAMGTLFTIISSLNLAKTIRDVHESQKFLSQVHDAKVQKILAEQDPIA